MRRCVFICVLLIFTVACSQSTTERIIGISPFDKPLCEKNYDDIDSALRTERPPKFEHLAWKPRGRDKSLVERKEFTTPTELVPTSDWPMIQDDLDFVGLAEAIDRQLLRYKNHAMKGTIRFGTDQYSVRRVRDSLRTFKNLVQEFQICKKIQGKDTCYEHFQKILKMKFVMYKPHLIPGDPRYGEELQTLFTGYYTPNITVKKKRDADYAYGIYSRPRQQELRKLTRQQIDFQHLLMDTNYTKYYAKDLFDLYLLHVQGGGRLEVLDQETKTTQYISYDGTNQQSWTFISKYMMQKGYIQTSSVQSQRAFLDLNPDKHEEIYSTCPSYVYFKNTPQPPMGSDSVPLTDNRSIATDTNYYSFKGGLALVSAQRPEMMEDSGSACHNYNMKSFSRFYLDQDTGGAIRGKARVDLYFGEGSYAEFAAYNTVARGDIYFLILKKEGVKKRKH